MRLTKTLGFAGALIVAALVGGTLINSAFATDEATDATDTAYCDVFRDALASELGVTTDELTSAGKAAANAAIDAAVAAGDLDEDRAATLRERIEAYDGDGCGMFGRAGAFGRGFGIGMERGIARGFLGGNVFEAAADALSMTSAELVTEVHDAGSLTALADAQGVAYDDVKAAILEAVQSDLDAAVDEGMPQDRADEVIERLSSWLDDGGEVGELGLGRGGHRGPMRGGGGFGPWHDTDDAEESGT
ncbi:MAG TPA: hypothetical protein VLA59_03660 [Patescibacteria group bacterium]|nr:hypothetical protein [Patescibacteria group bacterium]